MCISIIVRFCFVSTVLHIEPDVDARCSDGTCPVAVLGCGQGGTGPHIFRVITVHNLLTTGQLDTVVLLVVASEMMRGQAPQIFFS